MPVCGRSVVKRRRKRRYVKSRHLLDAAVDRMGVMSDADLARELGTYREAVTAYRNEHGIPRFRPSEEIPRDELKRIEENLKRGASIKEICEATGRPRCSIRKVAESFGWRRSWLKHAPRGLSHTVGHLTREEIFTHYDAGVSNSEIARQAGVSPERIRQVIAQSGRDSASTKHARVMLERLKEQAERSAQYRAQRSLNRERRKAEHRAYLNLAETMWPNSTIYQIAEAYGLAPNSMSWWIFYGRKNFGLFPKRTRSRTPQDWRDLLAKAHRMWTSHIDKDTIAKEYGVPRRTINRWMRESAHVLNWSSPQASRRRPSISCGPQAPLSGGGARQTRHTNLTRHP